MFLHFVFSGTSLPPEGPRWSGFVLGFRDHLVFDRTVPVRTR